MFLNYLQTVIIVSFVQLSIATYGNAFLQPIYYSANQMFGCHCPPPPPPRAPCPPVKQCPSVSTACPKPQPCKSKSTKSKAQGTTNLVAANTIDELETTAQLLGIISPYEHMISDANINDKGAVQPMHLRIESIADKYPLDQSPRQFTEVLSPNPTFKDDDSDLIQPPYTADNNDNSNHILIKRETSWNVDQSTEATPRDTDNTNDEDASSSTRTTPRTARKATTESSKSSSNILKCNSEELKKLMMENISETSSLSKRRINQKAESMFGGNVDVICSKGHFSYVYSSDLYCEATNEGITCIAFRQSSNN